MSQQGKGLKQRYYRNIYILRPCGKGSFQVTSNLNKSQEGKEFKQRYYRNLKILSFCRPVLLSGIVQTEDVAAGEIVHTKPII